MSDLDAIERERHNPATIAAEALGHATIRIQHAVTRHATHGYRALRQIGDRRRWIGPWHDTEHAAQLDIAQARRDLHELMREAGIDLERIPNATLGQWLPVTDAASIEEPLTADEAAVAESPVPGVTRAYLRARERRAAADQEHDR